LNLNNFETAVHVHKIKTVFNTIRTIKAPDKCTSIEYNGGILDFSQALNVCISLCFA